MRVRDLILNLAKADPDGESEVQIYVCRRYGGTSAAITQVRRFTPDGPIMVTDERDDDDV